MMVESDSDQAWGNESHERIDDTPSPEDDPAIPETIQDVVDSRRDLLRDLQGRRKSILVVMETSGQDTLYTKQVRKQTMVPEGAVLHHLRDLEEKELIEEINADDRGQMDPCEWSLTDAGSAITREELMDTPGETATVGERMEMTESRVEAVEGDMRELEERFEKLKRHLKEQGF